EVAWSAYASPDPLGLPVRLAGPELAPVDAELPPKFPDLSLWTPDSDGSGNFEEGVPGDGPGRRESAHRRIDAGEIPAGALGLLAEELRARGRPLGPGGPLYLRAPDVTLSAP